MKMTESAYIAVFLLSVCALSSSAQTPLDMTPKQILTLAREGPAVAAVKGANVPDKKGEFDIAKWASRLLSMPVSESDSGYDIAKKAFEGWSEVTTAKDLTGVWAGKRFYERNPYKGENALLMGAEVERTANAEGAIPAKAREKVFKFGWADYWSSDNPAEEFAEFKKKKSGDWAPAEFYFSGGQSKDGEWTLTARKAGDVILVRYEKGPNYYSQYGIFYKKLK